MKFVFYLSYCLFSFILIVIYNVAVEIICVNELIMVVCNIFLIYSCFSNWISCSFSSTCWLLICVCFLLGVKFFCCCCCFVMCISLFRLGSLWGCLLVVNYFWVKLLLYKFFLLQCRWDQMVLISFLLCRLLLHVLCCCYYLDQYFFIEVFLWLNVFVLVTGWRILFAFAFFFII